MSEASGFNPESWMPAKADFEARMQAEGVSYLAVDWHGRRFIAPMGSTPPPGAVVETVTP